MSQAIIRSFPDICAWVNYAEHDHPTTGPDSERSSKKVFSPSWNQVTSFEEAFDTLRKGWPQGLERMKKVMDCVRNIIKIETPVYEFHDDIEGMAPNVEAYLQGAPEDMYMMEPIRHDAAPTFVQAQIELCVSSYITADQMTWTGAVLFAAIEGLRMQGCQVEMLMSFSVKSMYTDNLWMACIPVPYSLDMDTLAFLFTHPACLRTIGFATMEHESKEVRQNMRFQLGSGYGRPTLIKSVTADVYLSAKDMAKQFTNDWDTNVLRAQKFLNVLVDTKFQKFQ